MSEQQPITRSGFVSLIGRPNVGKSTLMNRILGEKLAITSPKPQTTRNRITGVLNRGDCQLVFFDTPGIHDNARLINRYMAEEALSTLGDVDVALFMLDARAGVAEGDQAIAQKLLSAGPPVFLVVNKIDAPDARPPEEFQKLGAFQDYFGISALNGRGVDDLLNALAKSMPEGPVYYPDDVYTDRPERFIVAEYIREKIFALTGEEVPYSSAVTVEKWEDSPERNLTVIHATIHVERPSQKAILIGKGGVKIKEIGKKAREDIERLLGSRVFLELHVGVEHNWTKDVRQLRRFGYHKDG